MFESGPRGARFFVTGAAANSLSGKALPDGEGSAMAGLDRRIEELVAPAVAAAGYELVRVRITGRETKTLQVMAERPDRTMSADDCAELSHRLSAVLDEADPIAGAYRLEVSSPGIDRPLVRLKDFEDWRGYEARIDLDRMVEGRKRFKGVLAGVEDANIRLDIEGESETALIPFAWIQGAKLVLTDALVRQSLKAAKAAGKEETNHEKAARSDS
jgi:ribosome maturation factor RimP